MNNATKKGKNFFNNFMIDVFKMCNTINAMLRNSKLVPDIWQGRRTYLRYNVERH